MSSTQTQVIVVGQGLAGTLVSYNLTERGIAHVVVDNYHRGSASQAAAGIINPITGRRFVVSWKLAEIAEYLSVYLRLAQHLNSALSAFIKPMLVCRDVSQIKALNDWDSRRLQPGMSDYMAPALPALAFRQNELQPTHSDWANLNLPSPIDASNTWWPTMRMKMLGPGFGYRVDTQGLLKRYRESLSMRGMLHEVSFSYANLHITDFGFRYGEFEANQIIDCTGAAARHSEFWRKLPWRGTKGEALRITVSGPRSSAFKQRHFYCPIGDENQVWIGGTNQDHFEDEASSLSAKQELIEAASHFGVDHLADQEHLAAIRPTVSDRRPLVGEHPQQKGLYLCNGLGTKGASLAPYVVHKLLASMYDGMPLEADMDITNRFKE